MKTKVIRGVRQNSRGSLSSVCGVKMRLLGFCLAGFAELQMDKLDVVDSFGTVPFLDYKHFALRTFFPEVKEH